MKAGPADRSVLAVRGLVLHAGGRTSGRQLASSLQLDAVPGQVTCIGGASGSGKTTLLHTLAGLLGPTAGEVTYGGEPASGAGSLPLWRQAGSAMVLQNLGLPGLLTAQESIELPLQALGWPAEDVQARALAMMTAVGLSEHGRQLVGALSGGQRQRVAVARALVAEPTILFADEPVAALDERWREAILDLIEAVARRGGIVVVASSDPAVAAISDQVVTLAPAAGQVGRAP